MLKPTKNIFFSIKTGLMVTISLLLCMNAYAGDSWDKEREKAKALITIEKLEREVSFLSSQICQGRASGTGGNHEAAMWVRRKFEGAGLAAMTSSWTQGFNIREELNGHNVIGMLPAAKTIRCDRYIIVGAHYDHIGVLEGKLYPGADSNASGVTALTSLAEIFGAMRKMGKIYDHNIIFVAFDANEYDMKGSYALWDLMEEGGLCNPLTGETITKDNISLMVNIDQVGSSLSPLNSNRKDYMIMLGEWSLAKKDKEVLYRSNIESGLGMDLGLDYYGSKNFTDIFYSLSDQKVFVEHKMPAVMFTSGITMNNNKTWDRTENMDLDIYHKRIYLMYHWIEKMM